MFVAYEVHVAGSLVKMKFTFEEYKFHISSGC